MTTITLDGVSFPLRAPHDVSWLSEMGRVFAVFAENDSGNISFGVDNGTERYFVKAAGLPTVTSCRTQTEAVSALRDAMRVYEDIRHPNLIRLISHAAHGELYYAVFSWAEGACLFDHWNFDTYAAHPEILPPKRRFHELPTAEKLRAAEVLFSFLEAVSDAGYTTVDFYDGSLMYDFRHKHLTVCDIDLFRRMPAYNDLGADFFGTKRLKAPEEYRLNAVLDTRTDVFTLGALLFDTFFGNFTENEVRRRYENNAFLPCPFSPENWELNRAAYDVACRAVSPDRENRFSSIGDFHAAWENAVNR
ncbi:MAG: serine/threonine protein kinase [Clostridia bacterium]|nr:serine/threonine protein kinase [Clostridia bacterium]